MNFFSFNVLSPASKVSYQSTAVVNQLRAGDSPLQASDLKGGESLQSLEKRRENLEMLRKHFPDSERRMNYQK